ncbi:MAG: class I SAM-dependent methyltransferase, partial [Acidobacteriota bacterium]
MQEQASTGLSGVPETMLWTLHNRAGEAMRPDGVLDDPKAIEIYRAVDYEYERNFGRAEPSHALRSKVFDA